MTLITIAISIFFLILAIGRFGMHPVLALLLAALGLGFCFGLPAQEIVGTIGMGFGGILAGIGLIVVLGSIIGVALERSGAALVVAEKVLQLFGPKRPGLAVSVIGALVSIPVFCDSGFILLAGLNRSLAKRTGVPLGILSLALAGGLYTTHTLVPPTPGPIAAAGQLGAGAYLGTIMLLGGLVSLPVIFVTFLASKWLGKNLSTDEQDGSQLQGATAADQRSSGSNVDKGNEAFTATAGIQGPGGWLSFLPLLLPIGLIACGTIIAFLQPDNFIGSVLVFTGQPLVALLIGLVPAYVLARRVGADWSVWINDAVKMSGPILIITGAGGAFGAILKASSLQAEIEAYLGTESLGLVTLMFVAFLIAALLKTAQGSSTNALVITAGMLAPIVAAAGIGTAFGYALVVLSIGAGAMTVSHANDSYFWVVTRFSGISVKDAYRTYTPLTGIMGLTALVTLLLLSIFT